MRGRVSILMPVLNNASTVERALRSVLRQPEVGEVVFVDDGSTDGSADIARGMSDGRVRIVPGPRTGFAGAYNAALAAARLDYVAQCDGDDFFVDGRLAWQTVFLDCSPDHVAVAGAFATTDPQARVQIPLNEGMPECDVRARLLQGEPVSHLCAWLIRREVATDLGGLREWFPSGCDLDFQFRLAERGDVRFRPAPAYVYRLHKASVTHRLTQARNGFYADAASRFARQRAATGTDDLAEGRPPVFDEASAPAGGLDPRAQFGGQLLGYAHRQRQSGARDEALRAALLAVRYLPRDLRAWRTLAGILADVLRRPFAAAPARPGGEG